MTSLEGGSSLAKTRVSYIWCASWVVKHTWVSTSRKVKVRQGRGKDAKTVEKTVYKNSKTSELRVRKMVTRNGERKVSYVKF